MDHLAFQTLVDSGRTSCQNPNIAGRKAVEHFIFQDESGTVLNALIVELDSLERLCAEGAGIHPAVLATLQRGLAKAATGAADA